MRNENSILRNKAGDASQTSSRLDSILKDFEEGKLENRNLELKIEELEDRIVLYKNSIKEKEEINDSLSEKVVFLYLLYFILNFTVL